jgi:protein-tyrosine phosphatase
MCRAAAADGITHIVASPHANDRYHYDREYMQGLVNHLQELVGDTPKITLGCDFHLSYENLQDALAHPTRYVIGNTHYLLVEFSNYGIPQNTTDSFHKLGDHGITVIITHPERNPILRENLQRVIEWAEQGCIIQMTGSALTGFTLGERTRHAAEWLLERQAVHVLATRRPRSAKACPHSFHSHDAPPPLLAMIAEAL